MFEMLMGLPEPSDAEQDRLDALIEAEDALTGILRHVARTSFKYNDIVKIELALSAILGAFACLEKARSDAR